jgi:hypothetical protein
MRKLWVFLCLLIVSTILHGQASGNFPPTNYVNVAPSGACQATAPLTILMPSGVMYTCQNGVWGVAGGAGGGASTPSTNLLLQGNGAANSVVAGTPQGIANTAIGTDLTSMFLSSANPTTPGTNNFVMGIQAGSNMFTAGVAGATWLGGNNVLLGTQAGKALTSGADNVLIGYQAGLVLQGGSSTGCTVTPISEEDAIVTAVGENAAAALNTPVAGSCEISSAFFGQKAGASVRTSFNDTWLGVHSSTPGTNGVQTSTNSTVVGAWAGGGTAATTVLDVTFVGANSGGFNGAGGNYSHDVAVGFSALSTLDGTSANTADWNTAVGDSAGCSITSGRYNTFLGAEAGGIFGNCLSHHITGTGNIAIGRQSLYPQGADVSGANNVIMATTAATNPVVTTGSNNVGIGTGLKLIGGGSSNIIMGNAPDLHANGTEVDQIVIGSSANTLAGDHGDVAIGKLAVAGNSLAIAIGNQAAANNNRSIAIGNQSSASSDTDVAIGTAAIASGVNSIELGAGTCSIASSLCLYGTRIATAGGAIVGTTMNTATNCAVNSVSPAACGSAAAGAVVVPTTTTTYTVNTTAVTAASRIQLQPRTYAGDLPSTPTCVAPASGWAPITAVVAGTSFTFSLPSTSGQTCWNYEITN